MKALAAVTKVGVALVAVGVLACRDSASRAASRVDTVAAWRAFIAANPTDQELDSARARLAELEFSEARAAHTVVAYKRFLEAHPDSAQARSAAALLEGLRFNAASAQGTAFAWRRFVREHPDGAHRDEAEAALKKLELTEVATLDDVATLARIAAQNPEDPRSGEVSARLDEVAWRQAASAGELFSYLRRFPAGAHRDEARTRLLSSRLEGLLVSGLVDEAAREARQAPLAVGLPDWPRRLEQARAMARVEASTDERVRRALPGWSRRELSDVLKSLQAPDAMDRWQAAEELGAFVTVLAIDPLLEQLRGARNALIRHAAFTSLQRVLRALPRAVSDYEVAARLEALTQTASDAALYLTAAVLLDVSGALDKAASEYQRTWDPQNPDPMVLRRWSSLRLERRQFFAAAVTARQLAVWAKEASGQVAPATDATAVGSARELCAAFLDAQSALATIVAARQEKVDFPDDLEAFEVRAQEALRLTQARLRDAELVMLQADARARVCGNRDVEERLRAGEQTRLEALQALQKARPRDWDVLRLVVQQRDPSPAVRAAIGP